MALMISFLATGYKHEIIKKYFSKNKKFKTVKILNTGEKKFDGKKIAQT